MAFFDLGARSDRARWLDLFGRYLPVEHPCGDRGKPRHSEQKCALCTMHREETARREHQRLHDSPYTRPL